MPKIKKNKGLFKPPSSYMRCKSLHKPNFFQFATIMRTIHSDFNSITLIDKSGNETTIIDLQPPARVNNNTIRVFNPHETLPVPV